MRAVVREDLERRHRAAERGEAEPEQQRDRARLLLAREQAAEQDGGAGARRGRRRGSTAAVPSGLPQLTPKNEQRAEHDDQRLQERDRQAAEHAARRRASRVEVGVERMRRAMPSRRVSISQAAPFSELRKMNSRSWVLAPASKRPAVVACTRSRRAVDRTLDARRRARRGLRPRERARRSVSLRRALESLGGGERAALIGGDRLDRRPQLLRDASRAGRGSARVDRLALRAAARRSRPG